MRVPARCRDSIPSHYRTLIIMIMTIIIIIIVPIWCRDSIPSHHRTLITMILALLYLRSIYLLPKDLEYITTCPRGALAAPGPKRPKPTKRTLKNTQRIPPRCMHRRGGTRRTTVVRTRARPPDPCLAMALHNKDGRIPHHKAEILLLRRHLIKYKAY
jgi:hypothetical protein